MEKVIDSISLTITAVTPPVLGGTVDINATNTGINDSAPFEFRGLNSFEYTLSDGEFTDDATVIVGSNAFTITNPEPTDFGVARFGADIDSSSGLIIIGAPGDNSTGTDGGAAYLFSSNNTLLHKFTNPTPVADDHFGGSVATNGTHVLIGAPDVDGSKTNSGRLVPE